MKKRYKPRLTIEVTEEQYKKFKLHVEFGLQTKIFSAIMDDVTLMLDEYGYQFIVAMLEKRISYKSFMQNYMEEKKGANKESKDSLPVATQQD